MGAYHALAFKQATIEEFPKYLQNRMDGLHQNS